MSKKQNNLPSKRSKFFAAGKIGALIFLLISLFAAILCYMYYERLQSTVKTESTSYLKEISKHVANNASKTINDNFAVLGTMSTVIKSASVSTYSDLEPIVQDQQSYWNYQSIILVDESGVAYDAYGKTVTLNSDKLLSDVIIEKKRVMSSSYMVNNEECIIFAIPLDDIYLNNTKMCALAVTYDPNTFDQILSTSAFDGKGYAHIIRSDGTISIRSSSEYAVATGYNALTALAQAKFEGNATIDQIKQDIINKKSSQVIFTMNDQRKYMVCTPLDTQEWSLLAFVPVSVVNAQSEMLLNITIYICTFISLAFAALIIFLMISSYRNRKKLEQIVYVDPVTNGNTIQRFYQVGEQILVNSSNKQYALAYINICKFKVLNEQFGNRSCDDLLRALYHGICSDLTETETAGRLSADNFCAIIEYTSEAELITRFVGWYKEAYKFSDEHNQIWLIPIVEFGVYVIGDDAISIPYMIDRAKLSLSGTTQEMHEKIRCAIYDDAVRKRLFREKHLEDMMEYALSNNQFQVYLQPKYLTQSERVGGAEALVRWNNPDEGMIYPDEFISIFEKNGFIIQLDLWVFEQVCIMIKKWLDNGIKPVKISVNCSRVHLKNPNFLYFYRDICKKYQVPTHLLEIELTENIVFENFEHLVKTINDIHSAGFGCSMDDFGSGYSSLNLIKDIPVDTIKLDKIFFRNTPNDIKRTESVVGSIISMSKALDMTTVAEGVEERWQVDMLKRLGCDFIQGYYYSKPVPIKDFEKLTFGKEIEC